LPASAVPRIVMLSDGNQTAGDAIRTALKSRVPVHTVPLPVRTEPEVQVSAVNVPAQVREGEPFNVEVVIDSNHDDEGEIEVYRGSYKLLAQKTTIKKGENRFASSRPPASAWPNTPCESKDFRIRSSITTPPAGSSLPMASRECSSSTATRSRRANSSMLWSAKGSKSKSRPPQGIPDSLSDLLNFELLALSNVPATSMSQRQMNLIRTYVQDLGGGLIMIGGDQAFGLGGYYKSTIEEILPSAAISKRRRRSRAWR